MIAKRIRKIDALLLKAWRRKKFLKSKGLSYLSDRLFNVYYKQADVITKFLKKDFEKLILE